LESPKSINIMWPVAVTKKLSGLRSLRSLGGREGGREEGVDGEGEEGREGGGKGRERTDGRREEEGGGREEGGKVYLCM
jgi:hypothetical protein